MKALSTPALQVLSRMHVIGTTARLPEGQLDRKLYEEVNGALEALGGKWNRKAGAHVFLVSPIDALDEVVQTGSYIKVKTRAQQLGFFETPPELASRVVAAAGIKAGDVVLEPSAGTGNLVRAIPDWAAVVYACEVDSVHLDALIDAIQRWGTSAGLRCADFLSLCLSHYNAKPVDVVVMNPPFTKQADIDHVLHALTFLRPGGRLVAIMSASVLYRNNMKATKFRELVNNHDGMFEPLPEGSFKASGTNAPTVLLRMVKR